MTQSNKLIAAKRVAIAVAAVCASLSAPVYANDSKALLDLMLKKGVITQKDYDEFVEATKDAEENKAFKEQRLDQDVSKAVKYMQKNAFNGIVRSNGVGLESADGNFTVNLTGRVHFDTRMIDSDFARGDSNDKDSGTLADNFEVRRARIGVTGTLFKDIGYEVVTNAVGSSANLVDTAFINYGFNKAAQVRFGRFKQPFSLEELTSSNNIDFMERSYVNQLVPTKKLGAMLHGIPADGFTYALSVYQNDFGQAVANGGTEAGGRVTANFSQLTGSTDTVMHFGLAGTSGEASVVPTTSSSGGKSTTATLLSFRSEARGMGNVVRVRQAGEAAGKDGFSAPSPSSTTISRDLIGLEAALAFDAFKFQAEAIEAKISATNYANSTLSGKAKAYYVEAVYNVTGEKWAENYSNGAFGGLKIKQNFNPSTGGTGAWQVGVRYSAFDASDVWNNATSEKLGSEKGNTVTLGLTWFINPNARIMLNYAMTKFDRPFQAVDLDTGATANKENVIALRTQINF